MVGLETADPATRLFNIMPLFLRLTPDITIALQMGDNIPGILSHLDSEGLNQLKKFASDIVAKSKMMNDEEVPDLVMNFDEAAEKEAAQKPADGDETKKEEVAASS